AERREASHRAIQPTGIGWDETSQWTAPRELREIMWRRMGLVRTAAGIAEGLSLVTRLRDQTPPASTLRRSRLLLAEQMMLAAARRLDSCGAHYRSDSSDSEAMIPHSGAHRGSFSPHVRA